MDNSIFYNDVKCIITNEGKSLFAKQSIILFFAAASIDLSYEEYVESFEEFKYFDIEGIAIIAIIPIIIITSKISIKVNPFLLFFSDLLIFNFLFIILLSTLSPLYSIIYNKYIIFFIKKRVIFSL